MPLLNTLVKIANSLDNKGAYDIANEIDYVIKSIALDETYNPQEQIQYEETGESVDLSELVNDLIAAGYSSEQVSRLVQLN